MFDYWHNEYCNFDALFGKVITKIEGAVGDDEMRFYTSDGERYLLFHDQECCESVAVDDICGNLEDLIGHEILLAEVSSNDLEDKPEGIEISEYEESCTWTFYKLSTIKGSVTIRWFGSSNGYYSESVEFVKLNPGQQ